MSLVFTGVHVIVNQFVSGTFILPLPLIDSIAALVNNGIVVKSGTAAFARTLQGIAGEIDILNGDGVAGDPTIGVGVDVVLLDAAQTLTSKTLTSPAINGGEINNATIGVVAPSTGAFTGLTATGAVVFSPPAGVNQVQINVNASITSAFYALAVNGIGSQHFRVNRSGSLLLSNNNTITVNDSGAGTNLTIGAGGFTLRSGATILGTLGQTTSLGGSAALGVDGVSGRPVQLGQTSGFESRSGRIAIDDASTNTVLYPLRLDRTSSGTPAAGIGVGIDLQTEYTAGNTGSIARIFAITTALSQTGALVFQTANGGTPADRMNIQGSGEVRIIGSGSSSTGGQYTNGALGVDVFTGQARVARFGSLEVLLGATTNNPSWTGVGIGVTGTSGTMFFKTLATSGTAYSWHAGASGGTIRMLIEANGNVGIGAITPTEALDINSDAIRIRAAQTPASATATAAGGEICWDSNYIYVAVGVNTWKRAALSTW